MATRIVLKKSCRKQTSKKTDYVSTFETCPPETPHQLYVNTAIDAVTNEFGAFMDDLSDEVNEVIFNATAAAAHAVLEAANVSDDWRDVVKSPKKDSESEKCSCLMNHFNGREVRRVWEEQGLSSTQDLYRLMAWEAQAEKFPHLFCECKGVDDERLNELITTIDFMLNTALTAADVADDWERLYKSTMAKMDSKK